MGNALARKPVGQHARHLRDAAVHAANCRRAFEQALEHATSRDEHERAARGIEQAVVLQRMARTGAHSSERAERRSAA